MYRKLILGGPGAGKTTRLLEIMEEQFRLGLDPTEVAFVSFTRKAVREARERAADKFGFNKEDMQYFRTIHSMGFMEMGMRRERVFNKEHLRKVADMTGMKVSDRSELTPFQTHDGDKALFIENYARSTGKPYEEVWKYFGETISWQKFKLFASTIEKYKATFGLSDFTDMLEQYLKLGDPLPVRVAIIDESQDLNHLQWEVITKSFSNCERLYIAGDDDQAIYKWSGADVKRFLNLSVSDTEVLPKSYRLGADVFNYAGNVISSIRSRYPKRWDHADHASSVRLTRSFDGLDFSKGTWLLLARNKYLLEDYKDPLYKQGVPFTFLGTNSINPDDITAIRGYERLRKGEAVSGAIFKLVAERVGRPIPYINDKDLLDIRPLRLREPKIWHDQFTSMSLRRRMYYLSALRSGQKLNENPQVAIDTVHGVKGGQADNVVILTDISAKTWENYRFDRDDETRVFYVGITRCKHNLFVVLPKTIRYYPFKH